MSSTTSGTTQAEVNAMTAGVPEATVAGVNNAPAPADPFEQFMQQMSARMAQVEQVLGLVEPLAMAGAEGATMFAPSIAPTVAKIPEIANAVNGIISALSSAFADHPSLPAALPAPVAPPASASTGK